MIFRERKTENGYSYEIDDVFGSVCINSPAKLTCELLDDMVLLLLKQNIAAEEIRGEVKHKDGLVTYTFKKAKMWDEDDEEIKPCENTPTETKRPASAFIAILKLPTRITNWCKKFAGAFREAWKKV